MAISRQDEFEVKDDRANSKHTYAELRTQLIILGESEPFLVIDWYQLTVPKACLDSVKLWPQWPGPPYFPMHIPWYLLLRVSVKQIQHSS